jgi:hypothetical protein
MLIVLSVVGAATLLAIGVSLLYAYVRFKQHKEKLKEEAPKPVSLLSTRTVTNNGNPARYNEELELFFKETRDNTKKYVKYNLLSLYKSYIAECQKDFKLVPAEVELSFNVVIDHLVVDAFERQPTDKDFTLTVGDMTLTVCIYFNHYWDKVNNRRSPWRYINVHVYNAELE